MPFSPVDKSDLISQIKNLKSDIKESANGGRGKKEKFNITVNCESNDLLNSIFEADNNITVWLKPLSTTEEVKAMTHNKVIEYVSERKQDKYCLFRNNPKDVQIGDILIFYLVRLRKVICIRKVVTAPGKTFPEKQWPWALDVQAIKELPDLESQDNYLIDDMLFDFLQDYPNSCVDNYGNKDFSQLRRKDKLKLTKEFGNSAIKSYMLHQNIIL